MFRFSLSEWSDEVLWEVWHLAWNGGEHLRLLTSAFQSSLEIPIMFSFCQKCFYYFLFMTRTTSHFTFNKVLLWLCPVENRKKNSKDNCLQVIACLQCVCVCVCVCVSVCVCLFVYPLWCVPRRDVALEYRRSVEYNYIIVMLQGRQEGQFIQGCEESALTALMDLLDTYCVWLICSLYCILLGLFSSFSK